MAIASGILYSTANSVAVIEDAHDMSCDGISGVYY